MNLFLQYVVPILSVPVLILFKYGKPDGYLLDWCSITSRPRVYSAIESRPGTNPEYLKSGDSDASDHDPT